MPVETKIESRQDAIQRLKKQWLALAPDEKLGKTKNVTKELDKIEQEIKQLKQDERNSNN